MYSPITTDGCNLAIALIDNSIDIIEKREVIPYEGDMLTIVYEGWIEASQRGLKNAVEYLNAVAGTMTSDDIIVILELLKEETGVKMTDPMRAELNKLFNKSYQNGKVAAFTPIPPIGLVPHFGLADEIAIDWLTNHHLFWIGDYFDRHVSESVATVVSQGMQEGLGRVDIGKMLGDFFEDYPGVQFRPDSYWRGLSANAMNRSRNFGLVGGYEEGGFDYLKYLAVMDENTSSVCQELNGKIIPVSRASGQRTQMINSTNPEDIKRIAYWPRLEEIQGLTTNEIMDMGVIVPPFHGY